MDLRNVLEAVDFNWAKHIDKIWSDDPTDVAAIHPHVRKDFAKTLTKLSRQDDSASPLGWVVTGPGGSGKTHLLGTFRRETLERGGFFIIADMSGVKDFWDTILLHLVRSIRTAGPDGRPQTLYLLDKIAKESRAGVDGDTIPGMFRDDLAATIKKAVNGLYRRYDVQTQEFQDVLRAAVMLTSEDIDISDCGRQWLQGLEPDAEAIKPFGFKQPVCDAKNAVAGLSWLMSLDNGFSVFALDQLDAIVKQHYNPGIDIASDEASTARHIIVGLCDGLMTLRDITRRTLVVVSCLNDSWTSLREFGLKTAVDRYQRPLRLAPLDEKAQIEALVAQRMAKAFNREKATAPYPTWPFPPAVLGEMTTLSPRLVLQSCDNHISNCLTEGVVREATQLSENEPETVLVDEVPALQKRIARIDERYRQEVEKVNPAEFKDMERVDDFWHPALTCFARAFCFEQPPRPDADILLDDDYADKKFPLLHAKLRFETTEGTTRDRHLSLRALLHPNARAFQNRLKAAMTQSGIDRNLSFRKLLLVHFGPFPGGKVTSDLLKQFDSAGGIWVNPSDDDIRRLAALVAIENEFPNDWMDWVEHAKPTRSIDFAQPECAWLLGVDPAATAVTPVEAVAPATPATPAPTPSPQEANRNKVKTEIVIEDGKEKDGKEKDVTVNDGKEKTAGQKVGGENTGNDKDVEETEAVPEVPITPVAPAPMRTGRSVGNASDRIPVGRKATSALAGGTGDEVTLTLETLKRHIAILAGSGSGKTVLTRRLVEEAALRGTPAVVIDVANDLARMGTPWPEAPSAWLAEDREKAARYFDQVEVKIWTPGKNTGNPLRLRQIPDLAAVADDDELMAAVSMSISALRDVLKIGSNSTKEGIVGAALFYMARHGGGDLDTLVDVLRELPEDSGAHIHDKAEKMAGDMSAHLKGALITNPLLGGKGAPTSVADLLTGTGGRTRISVINLSGLGGSSEAQQVFVNQLAMTLFGWIKENPVEGLGGLLVIDEAKDFIPSQKSTPCKDSVIRFAAQARKYGMGLLLATQEPKSVDTKIISNCNTQFFGRQNSPATIEAAEALLERKGVARLDRGNFFLKSIELGSEPIRIVAPLCLSHHPSSPLTGEEVLELSRK
ncbi:MAG: DUF87 domain-containing protein [Planctomycetes bacterium]|nr:DUF87 domain-containing protein [Planctomycetota bacterium]